MDDIEELARFVKINFDIMKRNKDLLSSLDYRTTDEGYEVNLLH